ncbi:hypothetical protein H6G41_01570 [Tolypothrix sp. FACHB-123]|uniref:hypothetical protein n=1 Tax=Tolypothrix sp. FACHB-123 TaxID=2692868 RepID=UPI0016853924|nr:hypothetical protein [Tolypothrix sp. FACHB-123]MBD2353320.1 hypothetical protein [Tolypothrix sp. FACHB-123]
MPNDASWDGMSLNFLAHAGGLCFYSLRLKPEGFLETCPIPNAQCPIPVIITRKQFILEKNTDKHTSGK